MGLDKIFGKQEKPQEEKALKVVTSKESKLDESVVKLVEYFESSIPTKFALWGERLKAYDNYIQRLKVTPNLVTKVNLALPKNKRIRGYLDYKGLFLSRLIQTSYSQGNNNFEFEEVNADEFGRWLVGKIGEPIIIETKNLNGNLVFLGATNVLIKIGELNGNAAFWHTNNLVAEITNYIGEDFGQHMINGKIYCLNRTTLKTLKKQTGQHKKKNKFILGEMP